MNVFPEVAEAHLPLRPEAKKEKENCKDKDTENHNYTQQPPPEINFLPLSHLNGSVKLTVSETVEAEDTANKTEQPPPPVIVTSSDNDEPHSLWKFPKGRGKFTQVSKNMACGNSKNLFNSTVLIKKRFIFIISIFFK